MIDVKWLEAANCVIKRIGEQLDTARTASAAWKASAKDNRKHEEAAEKRVAELEEALKTAIDAIRSERRWLESWTPGIETRADAVANAIQDMTDALNK